MEPAQTVRAAAQWTSCMSTPAAPYARLIKVLLCENPLRLGSPLPTVITPGAARRPGPGPGRPLSRGARDSRALRRLRRRDLSAPSVLQRARAELHAQHDHAHAGQPIPGRPQPAAGRCSDWLRRQHHSMGFGDALAFFKRGRRRCSLYLIIRRNKRSAANRGERERETIATISEPSDPWEEEGLGLPSKEIFP